MIPYSADFERDVMDKAQSIDKDKREAAAQELGAGSMISKIVQAGYNHL